MEDQNKLMKSEEEEEFNKYFAKLKAKSKKFLEENKSLDECIKDGRNYALRGFITGNTDYVNMMIANSAAAVFKRSREHIF